MSTIRQQIVDALVDRLQTVTVANGYSCNAGSTVYSWFPENLQLTVLPCIVIRDTGERVTDSGRDHTEHTLSVDVIGFVSGGATLDSSARALCGDLAKCLMNPADRTLGGVCDTLTMNDGGSIQLEQVTDATRASVSLSLSVSYVTQRGDWSVKI